mmetsp:Transcript_40768/g.87542  ORF Transcript_40768/g.87542 Transcript_40768/m.87542 type:complete len:232 (-) Transcript_40768:501-1196(-)
MALWRNPCNKLCSSRFCQRTRPVPPMQEESEEPARLSSQPALAFAPTRRGLCCLQFRWLVDHRAWQLTRTRGIACWDTLPMERGPPGAPPHPEGPRPSARGAGGLWLYRQETTECLDPGRVRQEVLVACIFRGPRVRLASRRDQPILSPHGQSTKQRRSHQHPGNRLPRVDHFYRAAARRPCTTTIITSTMRALWAHPTYSTTSSQFATTTSNSSSTRCIRRTGYKHKSGL